MFHKLSPDVTRFFALVNSKDPAIEQRISQEYAAGKGSEEVWNLKLQLYKEREEKNLPLIEEMLTQKKVDANVTNECGITAIYYTICFYPRPKTMELLLKHGAKINRDDGIHPEGRLPPLFYLITHFQYLNGHLDLNEEREKDAFRCIELFQQYGGKLTDDELKSTVKRLASRIPFEQKLLEAFTKNSRKAENVPKIR